MTKDPICGMEIDPETARFTSDRAGKTYYFCSQSCLNKFERNAVHSLKKKTWFTRFLESIAEANRKQFSNKPPSCCGH
ncbi:MAG: YHS domain-containing protein [candidate division WOR-3 bacterium]|nr:MAG: YHS domain-containing protein [candidate division WOR-3 bacterium]